MPISNKNIFRHYDAVDAVDMDDYVPVYTGELEINSQVNIENYLEDLFMIFNVKHPEGFAAHSLSTSDVIMIRFDDHNEYYYCDWAGYKKLNGEKKFKG